MEETLEYQQRVARDRDEVFAFFSDAYNLERITPPFLRFSVLRVTPAPLTEGTLIDYRLRLHGVPMRWRSRIEQWQPPRRFVDVQVRGPYRVWHHTHDFEPCDGGTLIRDRVRYELPLGVVGEFLLGRLVRRDLEAIFRYRQETIARLFGSPLAA